MIFNWWNLFVRLALDHRPEAITSRPLLMQAIARRTKHAGQVTLTISSTHGEQHKARRAYLHIARFLARLRQTAEQFDPVQRWYRILSEALKRYLKGASSTRRYVSHRPEPLAVVVGGGKSQEQPSTNCRI